MAKDQFRLTEQAIAFLRSEIAVEALDRLEAEAIRYWRNGDTVEVREAAFAKLKAIEGLRRQIQAMADLKPLQDARREPVLGRRQAVPVKGF